MNKIEHLKEATKVVAEIQEKNDFSDAVCVATDMIAICLASYGFEDKMLDDAIDAIVKDIKNSM